MTLRALDRKLLRDLWHLKGQVLTIALVVASGVASFVSLQSTQSSLAGSRDRYYQEYRFGDVFAHLERAPKGLVRGAEGIPGVATAYPRLMEPVRLPLRDVAAAAFGVVVSIPDRRSPALNDYLLIEGRRPNAEHSEEALLLDAFAERNGIRPGDRIPVVMDGTLRRVAVVGIAASPEFIYPTALSGAAIPDDERFAVLWMPERMVAAAFGMEGAFNDLVVSLQWGADENAVVSAVDRLLEPFGGTGAVGRALQPSNYFLNGELDQLRSFATVLPAIFLGVAAFLLNVVLSRLVQTQRAQIAGLKALGYTDVRIGVHYLGMASVIVLLGVLGGVALGWWMGSGLTGLYARSFGIPLLAYRSEPATLSIAAGVSLLAGCLGAMAAVSRILKLQPAEAMRPAAPTRYRRTFLDRLGVGRLFGAVGRMVVREIGRRPLRFAMSVVGIAFACALLVAGRFAGDALDLLLDLQFSRAWREDVTVSLAEARPERAVREAAHLPGVIRAEGGRAVAVRFRSGSRYRDGAILGYAPGGELRQLLDRDAVGHAVPSGGLVLTRKLAELLGLGIGSMVIVEVREGARPTLEMRVAGLVDEMMGLQGHMALPALNRLLGHPPLVNTILLSTEGEPSARLFERLNALPAVIDASTNGSLVRRFREQSGQYLMMMTLITTLFAGGIAVGVIYNNARVALSERSRDLASLRVLGFTRREVGTVLLGELAVQVLVALPLGLWIGVWMADGVMSSADPERYRLPPSVSPQTFAFAVLVVTASAVVSALLVRRQLDNLDLIGVLKTRE